MCKQPKSEAGATAPGKVRANGAPALLGALVLALVPAIVADAANPEPVTVGMTFMDPITITEVSPLRFGLLDVNLGNNQRVRVQPNGSVVDANNRILGGTQAPAELTVTAQPSQPIRIRIENVVSGNGYTLTRWRCIYNNAATEGNCSGTGYNETSVASATLYVGGDVLGNGAATEGVDNGSFDVTIFYQ